MQTKLIQFYYFQKQDILSIDEHKILVKKIENFFIKKFNYPKTIIDFVNNNKKLQFYHSQVLVGQKIYSKMNSLIYQINLMFYL